MTHLLRKLAFLGLLLGFDSALGATAAFAQEPARTDGDARTQGETVVDDVPFPDDESAPAVVPAPAIEPYRLRLLDTAFRGVTAMPVWPHVKERSAAQEIVVRAALELGQLELALGSMEEIENWRRGLCHGHVAVYLAERGATEDATRHIAQAQAVADQGEEVLKQAWRRDRILARIAQAHVLLGEDARATTIEAGLVESEAGQSRVTQSATAEREELDELLGALERATVGKGLDEVSAALDSYSELFDRFFAEEATRADLEQRIRESMDGMPILIRLEALTEMTNAALGHGENEIALALVDEMSALMESVAWTPRDALAQLAPIAGLRHRAGDVQRARRDLDELVVRFGESRNRIVDFERGIALRPIAEAYVVLGDRTTALDIYSRAIEEGMLNPNAKPRSEDLANTCCSMALNGVEPDERLWRRIDTFLEGLREAETW